jgi:hypothetical protein
MIFQDFIVKLNKSNHVKSNHVKHNHLIIRIV